MEHIKENYKEIKLNIEEAAKKSGRSFSDITLVAVSKTFPIEYINYAASLGITEFGENKVQEFNGKYGFTEKPLNWHMIGHLQTNKAKYIVGKVALIHSLDSIKLAGEIDRLSKMSGVVTDYLLEVNIALENSKHGVPPENVIEFTESISKFDNICLRGLMCIAPIIEKQGNSDANRKYFSNLRKLYVDITRKNYHNINMSFLSMGMTGDYQTAIEEGANIIRIGTGLFGKR